MHINSWILKDDRYLFRYRLFCITIDKEEQVCYIIIRKSIQNRYGCRRYLSGKFFVKGKSCRNKTNYICINKKEEACHQLSEQRSRDIIFLSSNQPLLDLARDVDVPAIACQMPETDTFLHADMVVEGFEEVDMTFLQRVYERHFNIPWTILETERCIVRELELSDLDDLFSMYAEPGMTDYMEGVI